MTKPRFRLCGRATRASDTPYIISGNIEAVSCDTCLSGSHGHPLPVDSTFDQILWSLAIGSLGCRVHDWIVADQSEDGEDNGDYGQEDPACCVARVRDEVTEEDGNEEPPMAASVSINPVAVLCTHDRCHIPAPAPLTTRRIRRLGRIRSDAQEPERTRRYCRNEGQEDGDNQQRTHDEGSQVPTPIGPVAAQQTAGIPANRMSADSSPPDEALR